jgi:hypothetical protein
VVIVTPEKSAFIDESSEKFQGLYQIISDARMKMMSAHQVGFKVDGMTDAKYKIRRIDLDTFNGQNGNKLPMPATYTIAESNTVYKKRVPIKTILENL